MSDSNSPAKHHNDDARRHRLLEAALTVFVRFGYRKTSMDEVARAAGVSRQGLYLHFATKEELFRATAQQALATLLSAATAALADEGRPIEAKLVAALDAWLGRYVGIMEPGAADLLETSGTLTGSMLSEYEERFEQAVAHAITTSPLMDIYASADLSASQLARTLHATARGFKHSSSSREAFVENLTVAVRMLCAPRRAGI